MTHISVASPKGGVGKTIVALNLAASFAQAGKRVCVVDRDPQGSSMIFGVIAQKSGITLPFVPTTAKAAGFDIYIHDHAPGLEESYPSELVIVPTLLDSTSYLVHRRGLQHFKERGLRILPVATVYRAGRAQQRKLKEEHFQHHPVIADRALYHNLYGLGLTVPTATGIAYLDRAKAEIEGLRVAVEQELAR